MPTNIVFIDSRVPDQTTLIAGLDPTAEVYLIDQLSDGLDQIVSRLQGRSGIDALHIISHGSAGTLYLGGMVLSQANLNDYGSQLSAIGNALTETGDLLLYGCNIAAGDAGLQFIGSLAQATGADVAASTDLTGAAGLGGNWVLETYSGKVEAATVEVSKSYNATLPIIAPSFAAHVNYGTGQTPYAITSADVNGDGRVDVVIANHGSNTVSVLTNNGNGTFATKVDYATGSGTYDVTNADVNGDAKTDLVVANWNSNTVSVLTNNGNGTFAAKVDYATGSNPDSVVSSDVNGDGKADLIVTNWGSHTVSVLTNNGNGTFAAKVDYATGFYPVDVTSSDVNGDGKADLIVADNSAEKVSVFTNNGNGTFAAKVDYPSGIYCSITSADVNGDGKTDLVVANWLSNSVSVFVNSGNGTFAAKVDYATGGHASSVASGDVNGDGKIDLIVANSDTNLVSVLVNNGDGSFASKVDFATGASPLCLATADVNGDGRLDLLVANSSPSTLSVLMNTTNSGGMVTTAIGTGDDYGSGGVTVQADGKILVTGWGLVGASNDFALVRYNADGGLDTSFDADGIMTTDLGGNDVGGAGVKLQADGRILVAGYSNTLFAVARYNTNGSLDTSFSSDGKLTADITAGADYGNGLAVQSDGKVLVSGWSSVNGDDFSLARFNADGTLDTGFSGDGKLNIDFGGWDTGYSVVVQADGKILMSGQHSAGGNDFSLARVDSAGNLDATFGTAGKVTTNFSGNDYGASLIIQADGKILVAGTANNGSTSDFGIARYNTNGSLDANFGVGGKVTTNFGGAESVGLHNIALQADGKILVAGSSSIGSNSDFALARYNTDGSLDTSFSSDGKVTTAVGAGNDSASGIAVQANGKIVVVGQSFNGSNYDLAVVRYNTDGSLDTSLNGISPAKTGEALVQEALQHLGQDYGYAVTPGQSAYANPSYTGPWDCSEFVSWSVNKVYGEQIGLRTWNAYTGYWLEDANAGTQLHYVSMSDARDTPGAILFRFDNGLHHIAISEGNGKLIEANVNFHNGFYWSDDGTPHAPLANGTPPPGVDIGDVGERSFDLTTYSAANGWKAVELNNVTYTTTPVVIPPPVPGADDFDANLTTTGLLSTAAATTGKIETAGDKDWFKIDNLVAGQSYQILVEGNGATPLSDTFFSLRNVAGGVLIGSSSRNGGQAYDDAGPGRDALVQFTAEASGTHYVAVGGGGANFAALTGGYRVVLTEVPEPGGAPGTASAIVLDAAPQQGFVGYGADSEDYYSFVASSNGTATVHLTGIDSHADLDAKLINSTGGSLSVAGDNPSVTVTEGQTYYVKVAPHTAYAFCDQSPYSINVNFMAEPAGSGLKSAESLFAQTGGKLATLARFALASYDIQSWEPQGHFTNDEKPGAHGAYLELINLTLNERWKPLVFSQNPLIEPTVNNPTDFQAGYKDGYFAAGNAAVFVARAADALVLAFRGTNDNDGIDGSHLLTSDMLSWFEMGSHYDLVRGFVNKVDEYVSDQTTGIRKVYVVGHSLGAGLVDQFMSDHPSVPSSLVTYEAIEFAHPDFNNVGVGVLGELLTAIGITLGVAGTLGVPAAVINAYMDYLILSKHAAEGVKVFDPTSDPRIISFHNDSDVINAADFENKGLIPGDENTIVDGFDVIDGISSSVRVALQSHSMLLYQTVMDFLKTEGVTSEQIGSYDHFIYSLFNLGGLVEPGEPGAENDQLSGTDGRDLMLGGQGMDTLQGRRGDDLLLGGKGDDIYRYAMSSSPTASAFGWDTIEDSGGVDTIRIVGPNVIRAKAERSGSGDDVTITMTVSGGSLVRITIYDYDEPEHEVEFLEWDSGFTTIDALLAGQVIANPTALEVIGNGVATLQAAAIHGTAVIIKIGEGVAAGTVEWIGERTLSLLRGLIPHAEAFTDPDEDSIIGNIQHIFGFVDVNGTAGDDQIVGNGDGNILTGDAGNDLVQGDGGDDFLICGTADGNDTYDGGEGVDTIVFADVSQDIAVDLAAISDQATGPQIGVDQITDVENVIGGAGIDTISGNAVANALSGEGGNDILSGRGGDDILIGGDGVDTAVFSGAWSQYTLTSIPTGWTLAGPDGTDTLSSLEFAQFSDQSISLGNFDPTGAVTISGTAMQGQTLTASNSLTDLNGLGTIGYQWQSSSDGITWSNLGTGTTLDLTEAVVGKHIKVAAVYTDGHGTTESVTSSATNTVANINDLPTGSVTVGGNVAEDQSVTVNDTLVDIDGLGSRSYTWQSSTDGNIWKSFGSGSIVTLGDAQVGRSIRVTASYTDGHGNTEFVAGEASSPVANVNDAPTLTRSLPANAAFEDSAFNWTVPPGHFTDIDVGDTLVGTALQSNGDPLPAWLAFDPATRTFSGTPLNTDVGNLTLRLTVTDGSAATASGTFTLVVNSVNDIPIATDGLAFGGAEDSSLSGTLTASDEDLDPLSYSLDTSAGHGQVTVNANGSFDYRPDPDYSGPDSFVFRVSDGRGGVDLASVSLTVTPVNDAPGTPGASLRVVRGETYSGTLTASDPENDPLAFSIQTAPTQGDLILNGDGSFSYTAHADAGPDSFSYLVSDGQGGSTAGTVVIESGTPVDTRQTGTPFDDVLNGRIRNDTLTGLGGNDLLNGFAGNDLLNGGAGIDTLIGGLGDDTYLVDNPLDQIVEQAGAGFDTVLAYGDIALSAHLETLVLLGADLDGRGNADTNLILGSYGANRLDGAGGADTLVGGAGNDTYVIDQAGDRIIENPYQGEDSVESSISYTLGMGLEHLSLTGGANLDATGNEADNRITGNAGANHLNGGDGRDTLAGAGGDDTYYIDGSDVVSEDLTAGNDTIHFMVTRPEQVYQLGANFENLVLDGSLAGNGVGNAMDNRLTGNAEGNVLVGLAGNDRLDGGAGADLLMGGAGNDTYVVDHGADKIKGETSTGGTDVVFSSVSYILPNHVEELRLTGSANINATGNNQNNVLVGNAGRNVLTGGLGNDSFVFDSLGGQPDRIADFTLLADHLLFDTDVFTGIAVGALDVSAFASGAHYTAAQDASDRLICDTWNGYLYYDADGLGGTAAIQVAVLDPGLALTLMPSSFAGF